MIKIAIDAMGGDFAPEKIVQGVCLAAKEMPEVEFQLYGDETQIRHYLTEDMNSIKVIHCSEKILSDDEPVKSIRAKKDASMVVAAKAVKEGQADALFSAGNTGALLASGLLIIGRIRGIDRPGLMPVLPVVGTNRQFILMDVGANADCKPQNLVQFAVLASFYATHILNISNPRVALLNNGSEEGKGNESTKQVYELLKATEGIHFTGNVEAREILNGTSDIVVTDGFTGNAVLKTIEGTVLSLLGFMKQEIKGQGLSGLAGGLLLKPTFKKLKSTLDYSQFGGAVLLGVKAPVVKAHGSSSETSVYHAMLQIKKMVESHVIHDVVEHFETVEQE